ncbi:hypothetical protein TNCV_4320331 [Trichonephila clavipes]|nr:hypothetical protein TNCV_4320331 [Trichonephila clavipes]
MVCLPLTVRHHVTERKWAVEHGDRSQVLFMNKSQFSLECDIRRVFVWQERGTRSRYPDLHIIWKGNLMTQMYAYEILRHHIITYAVAFGDFFLLMQDNSRLKTVLLVENLNKAETIQHKE